MKFEINCEIFNNDCFFAILGGLLSILFLYIDKCIFIKNNQDINCISYIKQFLCVSLTIYIILYLKLQFCKNIEYEKMDDLNIISGKAPF